jgi:hypothetical protein
LDPSGGLVRSVDVVFQEYRSRTGALVSLEWDIWTEFIIVAVDAESEPLVEEIAEFLGSAPWLQAGTKPWWKFW